MASSARFNIVSPIGRIVEGDPWTPQEKDGDGNLRVYKTGPNAGQPNPQFYIGLAVPKLINGQPNRDWESFYAFVDQVAKAAWPNLFPGGQCIAQNFAWKIRDGDGFIRQGKNAGKPLSSKPGFAGHWVISFASSFPPQVVVETSPGNYGEITDKNLLKRGYYVRIGASVSGNDSVQTPGLYLNLEKIELKGIGEVISVGLSAAEAFSGATAGAIPEGMQALPAGFTTGVPSGFGGAPAGQVPGMPSGFPTAAPSPAFTPPAPQPAFTPPAPQPQPNGQWNGPAPTVAPGFTTGQPAFPAGGPTPQPAFAAPAAAVPASPQPTGFAGPASSMTTSPSNPAAPPAYSGFMGQRVMLPAANGAPYEAFIAQGWTDELLVQNGMMALQ